MIPKAAALCLAPMAVTLADQQGRLHTHVIESGYYRHPWCGHPVWFSCCENLAVFTEGRDHLARAVFAVRRGVDARWGLAEPARIPTAGEPEPFELDRHGAASLIAGTKRPMSAVVARRFDLRRRLPGR